MAGELDAAVPGRRVQLARKFRPVPLRQILNQRGDEIMNPGGCQNVSKTPVESGGLR